MIPRRARKSPRAFWTCLILFSLVYLLVNDRAILRAHDGRRSSATQSRLSPELESLARNSDGAATVRVIIQSREGKRRAMGGEVVDSGGILITDLSLVNAVVA